MNAFSAFGTSPNQPQQKHFSQSPFSAEPFKEYIPQPQIHPEPQITQPIQSQFNSFNQETQETEVQEEAVQENKIQENYTPYIPQVEPINYQTVEIQSRRPMGIRNNVL